MLSNLKGWLLSRRIICPLNSDRGTLWQLNISKLINPVLNHSKIYCQWVACRFTMCFLSSLQIPSSYLPWIASWMFPKTQSFGVKLLISPHLPMQQMAENIVSGKMLCLPDFKGVQSKLPIIQVWMEILQAVDTQPSILIMFKYEYTYIYIYIYVQSIIFISVHQVDMYKYSIYTWFHLHFHILKSRTCCMCSIIPWSRSWLIPQPWHHDVVDLTSAFLPPT